MTSEQYRMLRVASPEYTMSSSTVDLAPKPVEYRLYKRRFAGITALFFLNIVSGMAESWFGAISPVLSAETGMSLDQINWLGNATGLVFLPLAPFFPYIYRRLGVFGSTIAASILIVLSAWMRVAGIMAQLSADSRFGVLVISQMISSVASSLVSVVGPKYSELWFDAEGRTSATMVIAISHLIGSALGSILSPSLGKPAGSILILGIICTVVAPSAVLVGSAPPTPPTFAGSRESPLFINTLKAMIGRANPSDEGYMTWRQRIDFFIVIMLFAGLSAVVNAFTVFSSQLLSPFGYSDGIAGLLAATLLLAGVFFAVVAAPLLDRVFKNRLGLAARIFCPIVAAAWILMIPAVHPNDTAVLFVIVAVIGAGSVAMLPIGLELGVETTRNAEGSSTITTWSASLLSVIVVQIGDTLRAGPTANPPNNLNGVLIMDAVIAGTVCSLVFFLEGKQTRRDLDLQAIEQQKQAETKKPGSTWV